jgi:hypothetical protein
VEGGGGVGASVGTDSGETLSGAAVGSSTGLGRWGRQASSKVINSNRGKASWVFM